MKQYLNQIAVVLAAAVMTVSVACDDDSTTKVNPKANSADMIAVPFFVETESRALPSDPSQALYESREHNPVFAPDGSHVTWGEFAAITGSIEVECTDRGTEIEIEVSGLIPNGVYTIWNVTVEQPGFNPEEADMNITGIGAAGNGAGADNVFTASRSGYASISLKSSGGDLSMFGNIAACSLTDEYEWHVVGTYHIDGNTYGEDLGPDGTVAEQFAFIFKGGE